MIASSLRLLGTTLHPDLKPILVLLRILLVLAIDKIVCLSKFILDDSSRVTTILLILARCLLEGARVGIST